MHTTKLTLLQIISIFKSNKDFLIFTIDNNKVNNITFTNDLHRYYKKDINHFRVIDQLKRDLKKQLKFYI